MSKEVVRRMDKLEAMMTLILDELREMKMSQTQQIVQRAPEHSDKSAVLGAYEYEPNQWAEYTAMKLMRPEVNKKEVEESTKAFRPTISALLHTDKPLTAEEVAEITGRARNTESGYLNRLVRADLATKHEDSTKTYFSLKDREFITRYFPFAHE